jgi:uncharacterized membrane protein YdjX (TVP38/TMEM64 family)
MALAGKSVLVASLVLGLVAAYVALRHTDAVSIIGDEERLRAFVEGLGVWGPVAIMLLMAGTVVLSFIPNPPVSLAAGAAYGKIWGTIYAIVGSELGAIVAFLIARYAGYDAVRRWHGGRLTQWKWSRWLLDRCQSQTTLMIAVIVIHLTPISSFDFVSYIAGLTPLHLWRFAIATLIGNAPSYLLMTWLGDFMVGASLHRILLIVLVLSGLAALPFAIKVVRSRKERRAPKGESG